MAVTVSWTATDTFYGTDDGPGILPDQRDTVFDPGVSNADSGTGFGLSIDERIAGARLDCHLHQ